ncbi:MAG: UbiD family decarboxylase [Firmicutes bacterium]|nr:UbiD family decarboxylase [Bacillota bacterium]
MSSSNIQNAQSLRERLEKAAQIDDPLKRRLYTLGVITRALSRYKVVPILVGGSAVEFYTLGGYSTLDIDVVVSGREEFDAILRTLGFSKGKGERHWYNEALDIAIEAPDSKLAGSKEKITTIQIDDLSVYIIGIEDLILDRLRAFVFWKSSSDGEWAGRMIGVHASWIDWNYLHEQASREGLDRALNEIKREALGAPPPPYSEAGEDED